MKNQIMLIACVMIAVSCVAASFITNDLSLAELSKALAIIFLLLAMKCLQTAGVIKKN